MLIRGFHIRTTLLFIQTLHVEQMWVSCVGRGSLSCSLLAPPLAAMQRCSDFSIMTRHCHILQAVSRESNVTSVGTYEGML